LLNEIKTMVQFIKFIINKINNKKKEN